jgi:hypothetical protein
MSRWIGPEDDDEWEALLTGFTSSAFRLEGRQLYRSAAEDEAVERFLAGMPHGIDLSWMTSKLRVQVPAGRIQTVVRVVAEPPNAYTAMEITVYSELAAEGQRIRIIPMPGDAWPEPLPRYDFWLFDDREVWRMHYDIQHRFSGAELLDDDRLADHLQWRDTAIERSVPLVEYLAARGA